MLFLAAIHLSAQETPRLQLGLSFSPDYCFRSIINNDGSSGSGSIISSRDSNEKGKIGYTTGLNLIYNLGPTLGLELGLHYSNKGYQYVSGYGLTFGSMIDPRTGFAYTSGTPTSVRFRYNFHYLDVPLKVNFTFGHGTVRFVASAGAALNVLFSEKVRAVIKYDDGHTERNSYTSTYDYNTINISPLVSAGIDLQLGSNSNLRIMPVFRYGVVKIIDDPVSARLWNAGIHIGYYIGL